MSHIHINRPQVKKVLLEICHCPTCRSPQPMTRFFAEWYGYHDTCLLCGDSWQDGEMLSRPFAPRWRKENIRDALVRYMELTGVLMDKLTPPSGSRR